MPKMTKDRCNGCYNNEYNFGLGGSKECWSCEKAEVKLRKKVSVDQPPPWDHKPELYPSCYQQQRYAFMEGDRTKWCGNTVL